MRRRFWGAAVVVGAGAFAACVTTVKVGETSQAITCNGCSANSGSSASYDFMTVGVGTTNMQQLSFVPSGSGDDEYVKSFSMGSDCGSDFHLTYDMAAEPLPFRVYETGTCAILPGGSSSGGCTTYSFDFAVTFVPSMLGPEQCTISFAMMPATAGAPYTYMLFLSGTGATDYGVSATPTSINFGDIPVNTTSAPFPFSVTNTGAMTETINYSNSNSMYFSTTFPAAGSSFGGGSSVGFTASCVAGSAAMASPVSATFTFSTSMGSGSSTQITPVSCRPIPPTSIGVMPSPLTFSTSLVGAQSAALGSADLTISNQNTSTEFFMWMLDPTTQTAGVMLASGGTSLAPMGQTTLHLTYGSNAPSAGAIPGSGVIVTAMGSAMGSGMGSADVRDVAVNGTVAVGAIGTGKAIVDFGSVCASPSVATAHVAAFATAPGTFQLTRIDPPVMSAFAVTPSGGVSMQLTGNHGNEVALTVTASPPAAQDYSDQIQLDTDIPNVSPPNTPTATVQLHATGLPAGVGVDRNQVHFNSVPKGMASPSQRVTLGNCEDATVLINVNVAIAPGQYAVDFALTSMTDVPSMIQPGTSVPIYVAFTPHTSGTLETATLAITWDGGGARVTLDGTGVDLNAKNDRKTYYACSTGRPVGLAPLALALAFALRRRRR